MSATVFGVNGSIITVRDYKDFRMGEMVMVGHENLIGEVIRIDEDKALIQVFENTSGLKVAEPITSTGMPLAITLGPGIIGNIFDGMMRPLRTLASMSGIFISRGINIESIDMDKKWEVKMMTEIGDYVEGGSVIAELNENTAILHKIILPKDIRGKIVSIEPDGEY